MRGEPYQFFLNTPWGDQAFKKSLVGFFSAGPACRVGQKTSMLKAILALVVGLGLMRAERSKISGWLILAKEPACRAGNGMKNRPSGAREHL
jgi:hypothetical protein